MDQLFQVGRAEIGATGRRAVGRAFFLYVIERVAGFRQGGFGGLAKRGLVFEIALDSCDPQFGLAPALL